MTVAVVTAVVVVGATAVVVVVAVAVAVTVVRGSGRTARPGAGRGVNHLIHCSQCPYLPVDSEPPGRSSLKLVLG
jgi:hypothetical protein